MACNYRKTRQLSILIFLLPFAAYAEPSIKARNVFYRVGGNTAEEIRADIIKKTPVTHNSKQYVAYTKWNVNWRFWWLDKEDSCEITRVSTTLDIVYTMPKLKQTSSMPDSLITHWQKYNSALSSHEQGHKDLGVRAAVEVENQISNMGQRRSCEQLEIDANKIGKSVINDYSQIEKEYDRTTNHGLNTGAVFP